MPAVRLHTCVRSLGQISNAHWEYCPRPSIFEVGYHSVGHGWKTLRDKLVYTGPLPVACYCGRSHSPMIGTTASLYFLLRVPSSGTFVFSIKHWKREIFPLGMEPRQISLP